MLQERLDGAHPAAAGDADHRPIARIQTKFPEWPTDGHRGAGAILFRQPSGKLAAMHDPDEKRMLIFLFVFRRLEQMNRREACSNRACEASRIVLRYHQVALSLRRI